MATYSRPEAMNVTHRHAKVGLSLTLAESLIVAGNDLCGKMEMECRADKGLGIGMIVVELIAIQGVYNIIGNFAILLTLRPPRTDFPRPFCDVDLFTQSNCVSRRQTWTIECCIRVSATWRTTAAATLLAS